MTKGSDEGLTLKWQLWNSLQWPIYVINSVDNSKLPCYTLPPTQHHSFFRNLPPLIIWSRIDFFVSSRSNASQLVTLDLDSKPITVLCQMGDFGCGDGGWTPVMKIDGSKVNLIWRNILGGVFLRVMKRQQEIFRSVETTIESLSNSPIFLSRSLLAEIPLAWVLQYPNI